MTNKFCTTLTCSKDNTDRATMAFVTANAAVACEQEALVFLTVEGVRLSEAGYADDIHEEGLAPLKELMTSFVEAGGKIWACTLCFQKRGLDADKLVPGCTVVGTAKLVEFLAGGTPSITF